ncbi:membrane protein [Nonlabens sp. YIK11]|uniref:RDD family protein n=1 Tax=Nonlabens sp. YIK11 TaxID=1453349 RepID=UPI0006DC659F|nr:RDD family protein [Nonlabens sp. YIK11]KQC33193.1 membrane protein [Nonlabens sp. YIK11]
MSNTSINTAQNVNINYHISSLGYRITGVLVDLVIMFVYIIILGYIEDGMSNLFDNFTTFGLSQLMFLPVAFYSLFFNIVFNGRTPGKFVVGTKVVKIDGSPATWSDYLISWMLRLVDIWVISPGIGVMSIIFSDKNQRLGDMASDTIVIDTRKKTKISHTILEDVKEDYEPTFLTVNMLTDKDVNEIKEIYRLAGESRDYETLKMLRIKVEQLLQVNSDLRDGIFVRTVLKDYSYLTQGN